MFKSFIFSSFFSKGTVDFRKLIHRGKPLSLAFFSPKNSSSILNWGGGGGGNFFKKFFWRDEFEKNSFQFEWLLSLIFFHLNGFLNTKDYERQEKSNQISEKNQKKDLVFKDLEIPSKDLVGEIVNLFPWINTSLKDKIRVTSLVNRWYEEEKYFFSKVFIKEKFTPLKEKEYLLNGFEPKIRKIKFIPNQKNEESFFFWFSKIRSSVLKKILKIDSGSFFQWDKEIWERKFKGDLFRNGKIVVKTLKTAEETRFLDLFIEMEKIPTKKLEPEVMISNENLSGSLLFSDSNFLGLGLILKNKFTKTDLNKKTFQIDFSSHFPEFGNLSLIHESKGKRTKKFSLTSIKESKSPLEGAFKLDLKKKEKTPPPGGGRDFPIKEELVSISFLPKSFKLSTNQYVFPGFIISNSNKDNQKKINLLSFFLETGRKFTFSPNNYSNIKIKNENFFQADFQRTKNISALKNKLEEEKILFRENLKRETKTKVVINITSRLHTHLSSFLFLETIKNGPHMNFKKKEISLGFILNNLFTFHLKFSVDGRKKITFCIT